MDPATAFQLTCGAIQLIEFGIRTSNTFREIYKHRSSLSTDNERLEEETQRLSELTCALSMKLSQSSTNENPLKPDEKRLQQVTQACSEAAAEILEKIANLKPSGKKRRRDIPGLWLKASRERDSIDKAKARLDGLQKQLDSRMLSNVW